MKKIAIVTLTKNANYGNILQNIALQHVLQARGYLPETIINYSGSTLFNDNSSSRPIQFLKWATNYHNFRDIEKRNRVFRECISKHIKYSPVTYKNGQFSGPLDYDYYITGSDQVWNPAFGLATDFELLKFVPRHKKMSYAASFGVSDLESCSVDRQKDIASALSTYEDISVREESGKRIIENLINVPTCVNIDPTMLLNGEEWSEYSESLPFKTPGKYVLVYMLGSITEEYESSIKELAQRQGFAIVNALKGKYNFINPLQFIWLVQHAECICTDSFHASVFSVLFHRPFYIFTRHDQHADQSSRFDSLLEVCGLSYKHVNVVSPKPIDWEEVDSHLNNNRINSIQYLEKRIYKNTMPTSSIEILNKENCCGCSACMQVCPKQCITMVRDAEGFLYPTIDYARCVNCGICRNSCPILNAKQREETVDAAYAAYVNDDNIRLNSSSGGIFSSLAESIIDQHGIVFGAALDKEQHVYHRSINTIEDLQLLQGSKYVQSTIGETYKEVKVYLDNGITVLFTGTACQISGLKHYLHKDYANLYTVDVLCHGTPSPKLWERYLENQKSRYGSAVQQTFFRHKNYGWKTFAVELIFTNSTAYVKKFSEDAFMRLFLGNICLRPSCHDCRFKSLERDSDLTIGDAWGIEKVMPEMDDDKGTSVILVHSDKGQELLDGIMGRLTIKAGNVEELLPSTADSRKSVDKHPNRAIFFKQLDAGKNCDELLSLVSPNLSMLGRIKRITKKVLKKVLKA